MGWLGGENRGFRREGEILKGKFGGGGGGLELVHHEHLQTDVWKVFLRCLAHLL